jgi:hypothetical protein
VVEKTDRFLAITNQAHSALHLAQFEGFHRVVGILQVVLDQEDSRSNCPQVRP